jgi:hypothetical protein
MATPRKQDEQPPKAGRTQIPNRPDQRPDTGGSELPEFDDPMTGPKPTTER